MAVDSFISIPRRIRVLPRYRQRGYSLFLFGEGALGIQGFVDLVMLALGVG